MSDTRRTSGSPHWSYWGNGMPADLTHITEEMAAAARERRAEVMAKCPPGYASDVGEQAHYVERSERAGIVAALAIAPTVTRSEVTNGHPVWACVSVEFGPMLAEPKVCAAARCPNRHYSLVLGPEISAPYQPEGDAS